MRKTRYIIFLLLMSSLWLCAQEKTVLIETPTQKAERMAWFRDAKLGIFIHWGIYSVQGISESWSFHNGHISHHDYMQQCKGFTASAYHPQAWAQLIAESGARYAVLTSKHHDGVALFPTQQSRLNVVDSTPAGRDLIAPYVQALRQENIKVGLYFSLLDWSQPDYPNFLRHQKRYEKDSLRWQRFVQFNMAQLREIAAYKPDLYWFDGDWEQSAERWHAPAIRQMLLQDNPHCIINSRLQGYGDYATPEQGVPILPPQAPYWELCLTTNDSWGYQEHDTNYKSPNQVIRILVDCISKGGNLLLDIGPKEDGSIPQPQVEILQQLGKWVHKHKEAVYGTRAGLPPYHFNGYSARSKDSTILYLYLDYKPTGPIAIKGLLNKVKQARMIGSTQQLNTKIMGKLSWRKAPGILYIDVPSTAQDKDVSVIVLELDGPLRLFSEDEPENP